MVHGLAVGHVQAAQGAGRSGHLQLALVALQGALAGRHLLQHGVALPRHRLSLAAFNGTSLLIWSLLLLVLSLKMQETPALTHRTTACCAFSKGTPHIHIKTTFSS